jgi:hypothetical protein
MRKWWSVLLLLGLIAAAAMLPAMAQDATPEATAGAATAEAGATADASATQDAGQTARNTPVNRIRIIYLSQDGPVLVPYLNGAASGIQLLQAPAVTGWIELPTGTSLTLVPQGNAQSQAAFGPFSLDEQNRSWTTILIVGSAQNGLRAYAVNENLANIPSGSARVTVFHGIEGGPAVDVTLDNGTVLASGIGFPGSDNIGDAVGASATMEAGATAEAGASQMTAAALDCVAINSPTASTSGVSSADASATAEMSVTMDASATAEAGATMEASAGTGSTQMATMGDTFANCGSTFDVPAGTYNIQVVPSGQSGSPLLTLGNTQLNADTYYIVAAVGTATNPQVFTQSFAGSDLSGLLSSSQGGNSNGSVGASATMEATAEATTSP